MEAHARARIRPPFSQDAHHGCSTRPSPTCASGGCGATATLGRQTQIRVPDTPFGTRATVISPEGTPPSSTRGGCSFDRAKQWKVGTPNDKRVYFERVHAAARKLVLELGLDEGNEHYTVVKQPNGFFCCAVEEGVVESLGSGSSRTPRPSCGPLFSHTVIGTPSTLRVASHWTASWSVK